MGRSLTSGRGCRSRHVEILRTEHRGWRARLRIGTLGLLAGFAGACGAVDGVADGESPSSESDAELTACSYGVVRVFEHRSFNAEHADGDSKKFCAPPPGETLTIGDLSQFPATTKSGSWNQAISSYKIIGQQGNRLR